jgi:endoglucanase
VLPRTFTLRAAALLAALALGAAGLVAPSAQAEHADRTPVAKPDPRKRLGLFVDPKMPAYQQGGAYRTKIGSNSQAFWVIPEAYDTSYVRTKVEEYTGDAAAARKTPVLTIYGIPGRDCGQYSSGNPLQTAAQYRGWIAQVAKGLRGTHALVILEPDALPLFSSSVQTCPTKPEGWQGMLRYASRKLSGTGAWVYLDAGHSNWTPYDDRPKYLKAAGIAYDRGFSTNVSNFRPTADEKAYAATMLRGLRKLGIKGKHYVIDTSRNGFRPPDGSGYDVINPTWARLGKPPRLVFDGAFDGKLWVKHPGESDGQVNGGGPSGHWCDMLADRLIDGTSDQTSCPQ